jgi:hypothetical protein
MSHQTGNFKMLPELQDVGLSVGLSLGLSNAEPESQV